MMLGGIVIWYRSSVPLRNSAPQPYFSTRTTPRVLPTANPSAARLSIVFGENRSSTFHMMGSEYDAHRATVKPCPGARVAPGSVVVLPQSKRTPERSFAGREAVGNP